MGLLEPLLSRKLPVMSTPPRPKTQVTDPTGKTVADNIRRIRDEIRGWSTYELSRKLGEVGRPIAPSALAKIERAERRVDVGDLMALAVVLGVNPSALLFPVKVEPEGDVELTGAGVNRAEAVWAWADGHGPLRVEDAPVGLARGRALYEARLQFRQGRPHWLDEPGAESPDETEEVDG